MDRGLVEMDFEKLIRALQSKEAIDFAFTEVIVTNAEKKKTMVIGIPTEVRAQIIVEGSGFKEIYDIKAKDFFVGRMKRHGNKD